MRRTPALCVRIRQIYHRKALYRQDPQQLDSDSPHIQNGKKTLDATPPITDRPPIKYVDPNRPFDQDGDASVRKRKSTLGQAILIKDFEAATKHLAKIASHDVLEPPVLPLSPLHDPNMVSARSKYKESKARRIPQSSEFEEKIASNLHVAMLASPVRMCALSGSRLPAAFLLPMSLRDHPETGTPWQVPLFDRATDLASTYFGNTHEIIDQLTKMKFKDYVRIVSPRWKARTTPQQLKSIVIRPDMADFVLTIMRKRARDQLKEAVKRGDFKDSTEIDGLVLWCGVGKMPDELKEKGAFNLERLLGSFDELELSTSKTVLTIPNKRSTLGIRLWLKRLDMYLKGRVEQ